MNQQPAPQLLRLLARWDRRLRLQQSLVWLPRGMMAGLVVGVGLAVVSRLRPWLLTEEIALVAGVATGIGGGLALAAIWLRRRDALGMARRFDRLFGLKERVSTSLELATGRVRSPNEEITARQLADAVERATHIDARRHLPLRLIRRDWGLLAGLIIALVLLLALKNPQSAVLAQQQEVQNAIQEQIAELENLREEIANNRALDENLRENLLETLQETIEQLSQDDLSQEEAYATLAELSQNLNEISQPAPLDPAQQFAFEQAAQQLAEMSEELAAAFEQGALDEAAAAMEELASSLSEMDESAQQDLAEALSAAAEELAETNPELAEALQQATEALQEGNQGAAAEALQDAAEQLAQQGAAQMAQDQQAAQTGRRVLSQAIEQASAGAARIAQAGAASESEPGAAAASPGDAASPIGQPGQGAEGDMGQIAGQSLGSGNQSGEGQQDTAGMAGGAGDGTGEHQEGGFAASGEPISQDNNPDGTGLTDYEPVFAPQAIGGQGTDQMQLSGSDEPGDVVTQEGNLIEGPEGQSLVGYDEVFSDYANAANQALERDYIPLSLRDVVHDYFTLINP